MIEDWEAVKDENGVHQVQTRDGREVVVATFQAPGPAPILGLIKDRYGEWEPQTWFPGGYDFEDHGPSPDDLFPKPRKVKRWLTVWLDAFGDPVSVLSRSPELAKGIEDSLAGRIVLLSAHPVEWEDQ